MGSKAVCAVHTILRAPLVFVLLKACLASSIKCHPSACETRRKLNSRFLFTTFILLIFKTFCFSLLAVYVKHFPDSCFFTFFNHGFLQLFLPYFFSYSNCAWYSYTMCHHLHLLVPAAASSGAKGPIMHYLRTILDAEHNMECVECACL